MADYTVNLKLAVQGSKELGKLNKQVNLARKRLDKAGSQSEDFSKAITNLIKVENKYGQAINNRTKAIDNALRAQTGMQTLEQREHQLLARGNRLRDLRMKKEQALTRQQMLRRGAASAVGSGIIGGGFPLLFGQGPTAAIGGGLGGAAGGALSAIPGMGQFGFALSIAGTTIGGALDDLAKALAKPTENIEKLVTKLGLVDTPTGKLALELEKLGLTSSAATLLLQEFEEQFGLSQGQIKENAEKMTKFNNEINQLGTEITLLMANSLGPFMAGIIDFARKLNQEKVIENLQIQLADQIRATGGDKKHVDKTINMIKKSSREIRKEEGLSFAGFQIVAANMYRNLLGIDTSAFEFKTNDSSSTSGTGNTLATQTFQDREIKPLKQALEIEKNRLTMSNEKLTLMREQFKLDNLTNELKLAEAENEKLSTAELVKKIEKLGVQKDLQEQIVINAKALRQDNLDLQNFLKENAKERRSLEDEDQKNYDDAIKKMDKLKEFANASTKNLEDQNKLNEIKLTGSDYEIFLFEKKLGLSKEELAYFDEARIKIAYNNKLRIDGLTKQKQITEDIKNLLAIEMSTAIKGLITGANSLNDAFRNILNKMADAFLNIGLFGNVAGTLTGGEGLLGTLFGGLLATGGPAKAGKSYIVGEQGPELFTPSTSGMVTPNNAIGGSTNIVVNVDASGSNVEGDEDQGRELGRLISVAVQSELIQQQRPGGLLA